MEDSPDLSKNVEDISNNSNTNQPIGTENQPSGSGVKETPLNDSAVTATTVTVIENRVSVLAENGSAVEDGNHKRNASPVSNLEIDAVSTIKRPRKTVDEQQASVHVIYNSITRESKRKLEELLQKWSEWHSRHQSSARDSKAELESGEGTYFPALNVGLDKASPVSFWLDGETKNFQSKEVVTLDTSSIPLYDRGYSFGLTDGLSSADGGLEIMNGSRCFNCGSYGHALKECPKPRDNAAVNNARKQHKSKRNQNSMSRNPTRYYQDTPGGKFDGLRPGVLDSETRKLLGLAELDPPPWLNRMREMGYPPGYLDAEGEEEPSGIEIFGEEEIITVNQQPLETEDGEILDMDISPPHGEPLRSTPVPPKKMSVQFPGVNAPIPENADEWRWGARAWKFDLPRNRTNQNHRFYNNNNYNSSESRSSHYHEERWSRDYRDDGPPGVDPGVGGSMSPGFSPRFSDHESRGSGYGRSGSERMRRSPLIRESGSSHDDNRWKPYSTDPQGGSSHDDNRWRPYSTDPPAGYRKERNEDSYQHHSRR